MPLRPRVRALMVALGPVKAMEEAGALDLKRCHEC